MSRLRSRIAERMKEAQNTAAILTSFNEVDLHEVMQIRSKYKDAFQKKHGVKLGFMSFFVKACCEALDKHPVVNASVEGDEIIYHGYQDVGIAVSTDRGLMVPVLRNAGQLSLAEIESQIAHYADKARAGKIELEDLQGGTFSITNGGVFGSLLSTPLLNAPQSAILGMHTIKERPVAIDGEIVVRPMMYIALSYDHRIIDGKDAVQFLVAVKEALEDPARLLLGL
jgi:2-oxoglutarate dehydrogenase E2 component (dihydrolipoamide succinyltransferase)